MWKDNKYTKWYFSIIENAKMSVYSKEEYVENHHIIPKSFGGLRTKENMVKLYAREHFICHLLLIRMCDNIELEMKMKKAAHFFVANHKYNNLKINCKTYGFLKKNLSEAMRFRKQSPEEIEKRAGANGAKKRPEEKKLGISEHQRKI